MIVLWITNITFPEVNVLLQGQGDLKGSGGWLTALADALIEQESVELHMCSINSCVSQLTTLKGKSIIYHILPFGKGDTKYNKEYEDYYRMVYEDVNPDVVHIHGTEYPHSLAALRACGSDHTVVSIQGLVSVIARYNRGGISKLEALRNTTFHDIVRGGIIREQKEMFDLGRYEETLISETKHIIGRTSFDKQHTWAINPQAHYYHCGELLRKEFYESEGWDYGQCKPHSIFMSQAAFPIKGLHIVIKALAIVIKHYPDVQLRVAGRDITFRNGGFKDKFRISGYGLILKKLISKYKLNNHVTFTGQLNAEDMVKEYLRANLFLCPSSIENSPNSLAEAQLLGVPCVASFVGGIPDMMKGIEENLYRYDDAEMLAYKICDVFGREIQYEKHLLEAFEDRHDVNKICEATLKAYTIIGNKEK